MSSSKLHCCIFAIVFSCATFSTLPARSAELSGKTVSGGSFTLESSSIAGPSNPDGFWGYETVVYKNERKGAPEVYRFPVLAPPVVREDDFGLLSISEKNGGMNGTYRVTFLYPTDQGLTTIGAVEFDLDNGKYIDVSQIPPKWIRGATEAEKVVLIQWISTRRADFIDRDVGQSLENAMLFFAMPVLANNIKKQDPLFFLRYSERLSNEIDSSMANLIRRRFLGKNISLCDNDQFDVFACKLDKKTVSICSGNRSGATVLEYRAGSNRKIELSLTKPFQANDTERKESESFENAGYKYTVTFGRDRGLPLGEVIVESRGKPLARQQCQREMIEPYLIPKK